MAVLLYCPHHPIISPHYCTDNKNRFLSSSPLSPAVVELEVLTDWTETEVNADCGPVMIFILKNSLKCHNVVKNVSFWLSNTWVLLLWYKNKHLTSIQTQKKKGADWGNLVKGVTLTSFVSRTLLGKGGFLLLWGKIISLVKFDTTTLRTRTWTFKKLPVLYYIV